MDQNSLKSYRPVANITFLSKIVEKAATCQVTNHVESNHLGEKYQSAYRRHHSTETALLRVKNDVLKCLDNGKAVIMVLLDMSAAFDTVDHHILLQRLNCRFGIGGTVNRWFASYLCDRTTKVTVKNNFSSEHTLKYSLPQGSIIGPLGFTLYTTPVGDIIRDCGIMFHVYADDIQLFLDFDPKIHGDSQRALTCLTSCITKINDWMVANTLQLNQEKTEFIVFASNRVLPHLANLELRLGNVCIHPTSSVKNLGIFLDAPLNMSEQISSLCKSINFHIRNLWRIRRFITHEACHNAVRGLVLSRLDYGNSLLLGAREGDLKRLQRLQNKAARLVYSCGRDQPSAGLLKELHWLPVKERIEYKIMLYVYKCINEQGPTYLGDLVSLQRNDPLGTGRRLRSHSDYTRLSMLRSYKKAGDSSFAVAAPRIWNNTSVEIREAVSVSCFKRLLKTSLFPC